jgi:RNA-directed DNA polymerase
MPEGDITVGGVMLFKPSKVPVTRYRYRGTRIPNPWGPGPHAVGVSV